MNGVKMRGKREERLKIWHLRQVPKCSDWKFRVI